MTQTSGVFEMLFPRAGRNPIKFFSFSPEEAAFRSAMEKIAGPPRSETLAKGATERERLGAAVAEHSDIVNAVVAMGRLLGALDRAVTKIEKIQAHSRELESAAASQVSSHKGVH